jgi:filamentous hemagglutinin family protein
VAEACSALPFRADPASRQRPSGYRRRTLRNSFATMTAIGALMPAPRPALAGPTGGSVVAGSAGIQQSGTTTNINQSSNNAVINWQGFSIGSNETVNFNQPSASSATLNRVIGNETSVINGALNANGNVFIVNPSGVLFGKGAAVNVGGLVASTLVNGHRFNLQNGNPKQDAPTQPPH